MPRYLIDRQWNDLDDEEMRSAGERSRRIAAESFPDIKWEHSHVVTDSEGNLKSFCIYEASAPEVILEHAKLLGEHNVLNIYEIGGDVTPGDFPI